MPSTSSANSILKEGIDAPASTATPYSISAGQTFSGSLAKENRDWVAIDLAAGERIEVKLTGVSLADPYLRIRGGNGAEIRANDDADGSDSRLLFGSAAGGKVYLSVGSYDDAGSGSYRLAVTPHVPEVYSWDRIADYLTDGYWASEGRTQGRTFDVSAETGSNGIITYDVSGLAATTAQGRMGRQHVEWALEAWSSVTGIRFVKSSSADAKIRFDDNGSGANNSTTFSDGHIIQSRVNIGASFLPSDNVARVDSYLAQTYLHEIGHALGLGHAGPYDGLGDFHVDAEYLNDSWQSSVMSYISQSQNTSVTASRANAAGPQIADILAIQNIYGAPVDTRPGNTVYGHNSNAGGYLDKLGATKATWTIFDSVGNDTIDYSRDARNQTYDLRDGHFSSVMGVRGNIGIAVGTIIENVRAGFGNDNIRGNAVNNFLDGNGGHDTIRGYEGDDTIMGDAGNDILSGGSGDDFLGGGGGNDRLLGDTGNDRLYGSIGNDFISGGEGNDILSGSTGSDTLMGDAGRDILRGGGWGDVLSGGNGNDALFGEDGDDYLYGGMHNDMLDGGSGNDRLDGGIGNDRLHGSGGNDLLFGGTGSDTLMGDAGRDILRGGGWGDVLSGGNGNDALFGEDGHDYLYGGTNNDVLDGGSGNDRLDGGIGNDRLLGSGGNDLLFGSSGNDTLDGSSGNDRLEGGQGPDQLRGGSGADAFVFRTLSDSPDGGGDRILDFARGDKIDLRGVDADATRAGNQEFSFVGGASYKEAGELRFVKIGNDGYLFGDVDGDRGHDFVITLVGVTSLPADALFL